MRDTEQLRPKANRAAYSAKLELRYPQSIANEKAYTVREAARLYSIPSLALEASKEAKYISTFLAARKSASALREFCIVVLGEWWVCLAALSDGSVLARLLYARERSPSTLA